VKLYHTLLGTFTRTSEAQLERIEHALREGRRLEAADHLHAVKGVAANLGLERRRQQAAGLETSLRSDTAVPDGTDLHAFSATLRVTREALSVWVAAQAPREPDISEVDPLTESESRDAAQAVKMAISSLYRLLSDYDAGAVEALEERWPILRRACAPETAARLRQSVGEYNFDEARSILEQLALDWEISLRA